MDKSQASCIGYPLQMSQRRSYKLQRGENTSAP
jgi:hypothetical protein